ncbi:hypothetical protein [Fontivita pretiosa]|uniref:hypothetical protein n=1 Tax=Fontivita pretiosa TaxID=2989684 RepID=UPI003D166EE0
MDLLAPELRLLLIIAVSALVLAGGYWFARRITGREGIAALVDAGLIFYAVQYVVIGAAGVVGALTAPAVLIAAAIVGVGLWSLGKNPLPCPLPEYREREKGLAYKRRELGARWVVGGCAILVVSYILSLIWLQRAFPPVANDSLTYHLPAAVQWIQDHRISLLETWYFNPANTYSPLAGSMFITWWLAPIGNDALARFVQTPALLLCWLAMLELARACGARSSVAAIVATAAVLSRPFFSQAILEKDDVFVSAFFACALAGLARDKLSDRFGPWRVGIAVGLMLATKYTAMLSLPLFLLAIDAPICAGWRGRHWLIAILLPALLAGPWFLRNLLLTGNPVYPVDLFFFDGMFRTARSEQLQSIHGIWKTLAGGYYSLPAVQWGLLLIGWVSALAKHHRIALRQPLLRTIVAGPIVGIGLFLAVSPYDELRFAYPSLLLLFACAAVAMSGRKIVAELVWSGMLLLSAMATNFIPENLKRIVPMALGIWVAGLAIVYVWSMLGTRLAKLMAAAIAGVVLFAFVFVYWSAFVHRELEPMANFAWQSGAGGYAPLADAWVFVRTRIPPGRTLAYANTHYVYPLYGFDLTRRVVRAPLRADRLHLHELPKIPGSLPGERIVPAVVRNIIADADRDAWLANLRRLGAEYLLIATGDLTGLPDPPPPPELIFASQDPAHFQPIFQNEAAVIYRIVW